MKPYSCVSTQPGDQLWELWCSIPALIDPQHHHEWATKPQPDDGKFWKGLILYQDSLPIGRLGLYRPVDFSLDGQACGMVGHYACVNNPRGASYLLGAATQMFHELGWNRWIGPMDGSTWDAYRFRLENRPITCLGEQQHPTYFANHFQQAGCEVMAEYVTSKSYEFPCDPNWRETQARFERRGIRFRTMDMDRYEEELRGVFPLCKAGFRNNYVYTDISESHFLSKYLPLRKFLKAEWIFLAEDEGELVGLMFAYPNLPHIHPKSVVAKTVVRAPGRKYAGIGRVLANLLHHHMQETAMEELVHAFMILDGNGQALSHRYFGELYQRYHLYGFGFPQSTPKRASFPTLESLMHG
ncbi:hypothetical protein [Pontibacter sp. G13]|uniref:hypothetical protein n=1 Tax=Pontibacter sp. G13 TaxID=3074898 RepID=UPI00288A94DE|nr:hypothetical protein [Pontibacter sp. G13]WNJ17835.1 hypothetical protein RJD25_23530 [Pontibacter sp. G13]